MEGLLNVSIVEYLRFLSPLMFRNIKRDKWKHFFVGLGLGLVLEAFMLHFFPQFQWVGSVLVFFFIALISYGFELFSLVFKKGHYDVLDAVAGAVGGLLGVICVLAVSCTQA